MSEPVSLGPLQNIRSVHWNPEGPFLWLMLAYKTGIPGFGFQLEEPELDNYDVGSATTTSFGSPEGAFGFDQWEFKYVYFAEVINTSGDGSIGAGVYFVNVGLIYKNHRDEFRDQMDPALKMKIFTGFGGDPGDTFPGGQAKARAVIYTPESRALIPPSWQPTEDVQFANTLDGVLAGMELIGGEIASRPGGDPWDVTHSYSVPTVPANVDMTFGYWLWDYLKRNTELADPELTGL